MVSLKNRNYISVSNWIRLIYTKGYMVITHSTSTQEKWKTKNLYRFLKIKCNHKEGSKLITIYR